MAYEVTATRRRPQSFENLVGQEFVAETFKNAIQSKKIAHAYLFSGPRGCGKTSTARILSKALNCEKGPTATPCGQCSACKEITAGSSLDVIEIDGASNTSVNDVRQIKDEVLFPPNSCRYKIYIIDEVHMLSTSAFNALLKTIEEPPSYCIFIFATTELQKVPATIKSRCQQFNFRLVPVEKVKEQLSLAAKELGIKAENEALYWIAREAGGSMRDSYTLFDQVAAFSDGEITYDKIRDKLGLVGIDRLNELFTLCVCGNAESALLKLDEYLQNGVSIEQLISNCTEYLRSLLLIKSGVKKESLLGQSAERYSKDVVDAWNSVQIERALSIFMQLYRDIRYSLNPRYEFELSISRLCWLKDYVSPLDVKRTIDAVKPILSSTSQKRTITVTENKSDVQKKNDVTSHSSTNEQKSDAKDFSMQKEQSEKTEKIVIQENQIAPNALEKKEAEAPQKEKIKIDPIPNGLMRFSALDIPEETLSEAEAEAEATILDDENFMDEAKEEQPKNQLSDEEKQQNIAESYIDESEREKTSSVFSHVEIDLEKIDTVKESIIAELSVNDAMLASNLMQTTSWTLNGDKISAVSGNSFEFMQIQKQVGKISEILSRIYSRQIFFEITLEQKKNSMEEKKLPVEVEIIRDVFRGTVLR